MSTFTQIKELERELAKANRKACEYYLTDESVIVMKSPDEAREARRKAAKRMIDMERELADMTKQRDELAEALASLLSGVKDGWFNEGKWWHTGIEQAEQALEATKGGSHE